MKTKPTNHLRLKKNVISNLTTIVAGGPPVPPGSNSCIQEETCLTCGEQTCQEQSCDRTC
ncbi:hypothetical protein H2O64_18750 [Kordia sp. YSTF-M3]|uniref:Uncharacterized protein n=1 Tax=Kordia aestuariivivens TaxID=2759037 RepID=A0ABR7QDR4_9FLAO|nr:hypothetical protein [Kordia aestuariivivens]MBC8756720.1 hypothetical protein [Kordia aestuariivivens]